MTKGFSELINVSPEGRTQKYWSPMTELDSTMESPSQVGLFEDSKGGVNRTLRSTITKPESEGQPFCRITKAYRPIVESLAIIGSGDGFELKKLLGPVHS